MLPMKLWLLILLLRKKTCWLAGSLDASVRTYDAQGSAMEGLVTRAIAVPVRCVAIDPKGEKVAVTSE